MGTWKTKSVDQKLVRWNKMTDPVIHLLVPVSLNLLHFFIKIVLPWQYQLLHNANHRKKMRTFFCLCYKVNQTQITFKYPQYRRVLKYRKHKYNDTLQGINRLLVKDIFVIFVICRLFRQSALSFSLFWPCRNRQY